MGKFWEKTKLSFARVWSGAFLISDVYTVLRSHFSTWLSVVCDCSNSTCNQVLCVCASLTAVCWLLDTSVLTLRCVSLKQNNLSESGQRQTTLLM